MHQQQEDTRVITLSDAITLLSDQCRASGGDHLLEQGAVRGLVTMTDGTGRVIFRKRHNLVVLRGRTFILEQTFNDVIGSSGVNGGAVPYISDLNRRVIAFGVGSGGTPPSAPFSPYAPPPSGVQLTTPVAFRVHDTAQSASGNPFLFIPSNEIAQYSGGRPVTGKPTQTAYYMKRFMNHDPDWVFNATENTVYKRVMLFVGPEDCRPDLGTTGFVNELCLYFAKENLPVPAGAAANLSLPEMFSRITFPTEPLPEGKTLTFEYRIYA